MPSLRVHLKASKELLGTQFLEVHKILDTPSFTMEHRFRHNPETVDLIFRLYGEEAKREAWLHIFMDVGLIEYR